MFLHVKRKINNRFHVVSVSQKWAGQSKISLDVFFLAYLIIAMAAPQPPPTTYLTRTSPWCKEAFAIMHCYHEVWDAKHRGKFPGPNSGLLNVAPVAHALHVAVMHPGDCAQRQVHPLAHHLDFLASLVDVTAVHGKPKSPGTPGRLQMEDWMAAQILAGRNFNWDQLKALYRHYKIQRTTDIAPDGTVQGPTPSIGGVGVVQDDYLARLAARVHSVAHPVAVATVTQLTEHAICTRGPGWKLFLYVVEQNQAGLRDVVEDWIRGEFHSATAVNRPDNASKNNAKDRALQATLGRHATNAALDWGGEGDDGVPAPAAAIKAEFRNRCAPEALTARAAQTICQALHLLAFAECCKQLSECDLPALPSAPSPGGDISGTHGGGSPCPVDSANAAAVCNVASWLALKAKNAVYPRRGETHPRATSHLSGRERSSDLVQRQLCFLQGWAMDHYESNPELGRQTAKAAGLPTSVVDSRSRSGQANYTSLSFYVLASYFEKCFAWRIRFALANGGIVTDFMSRTAAEIAASDGAMALLVRTFAASAPSPPSGAVLLLMKILMHNYVRMRGKDFTTSILVNSARNACQSAGFRAKISVKHASAKAVTTPKVAQGGEVPDTHAEEDATEDVPELNVDEAAELQRLVEAGEFD